MRHELQFQATVPLWCHRCWEHNLGHDIELRYWFLGTFYGTRGLRIGRWLPSQSNIIVSFEGSFTHQALKSMHFQLKNGVYAKGHISYKNAWNLMVKQAAESYFHGHFGTKIFFEKNLIFMYFLDFLCSENTQKTVKIVFKALHLFCTPFARHETSTS